MVEQDEENECSCTGLSVVIRGVLFLVFPASMKVATCNISVMKNTIGLGEKKWIH
jgi:hypothetical protein